MTTWRWATRSSVCTQSSGETNLKSYCESVRPVSAWPAGSPNTKIPETTSAATPFLAPATIHQCFPRPGFFSGGASGRLPGGPPGPPGAFWPAGGVHGGRATGCPWGGDGGGAARFGDPLEGVTGTGDG